MLTNTIYFKAAWEDKFSESLIQERPFHLLDGRLLQIPMMTNIESYKYYDTNDFQAVELPYIGGDISMLIVLPAEGKFIEFEKSFDTTKLKKILDSLDNERVKLTMPKYKFESSFMLRNALSSMGMPIVFSANADFSGISPVNESLLIREVIHKAFIELDENGTEAAAATAVVIMPGSAKPSKPNEPKIMTVDRPFIFLIRDNETGTILFLGRVINPEE